MKTYRLKVGVGGTALHVQRFPTNPLITPAYSPTLSENINGPSLIRVPDWLPCNLNLAI